MDNFTGDFFKLIGKPLLWNTTVYGTVAVHVKGISPNGRVAVLTIDGGEASTQAQRFPELSDGVGFAILGDLSKRVRPLKRAGQPSNAIRDLAIEAGLVTPKVAVRKPRGRAGEIRRQAAMGKTNNGEVTF